ncbi:glycosyltransferase family 4 protein [Novosphingobium marinum]|uniref:Glycosyltransferase involved in cell wall biosynthesis n=1 Tax=Novosphingobium marinum TaxID=1514948 RepID=A0A7Z0BUE5_9SPHN|nr:glycosyltransferase family 4 protein [Novosphingobium marinum]NYH97026.1 glycosyltransferase involved in cell wall biosynthesis [Novosphingobium marinum]
MGRVLLYSPVDATIAGGVQTVVGALAGELDRNGYSPETIWGAPPGRAVAGKSIQHLFARPDAGRRTHLPSLLKTARMLIGTQTSIVNVHYLTPAAHNFLFLRRIFGHRVVISVHGSDLLNPDGQEAEMLPEMLSQADAVTAVSPELRDRASQLANIPAGSIRVISNGIDTDFWAPGDGERPSIAAPHFVAVGRLEPVKGFDILLEAIASARRQGLGATASVIGEGSQRDNLVEKARILGISDRITFPGRMSPEEIRAELRNASAFVLSSRREGLPLSVLEAMACGTPCVATDVGGVADAIADGGIIVPPDNPDALAEAFGACVERSERHAQLSRRARIRAYDFSIRSMAEAYGQVFRALS